MDHRPWLISISILRIQGAATCCCKSLRPGQNATLAICLAASRFWLKLPRASVGSYRYYWSMSSLLVQYSLLQGRLFSQGTIMICQYTLPYEKGLQVPAVLLSLSNLRFGSVVPIVVLPLQAFPCQLLSWGVLLLDDGDIMSLISCGVKPCMNWISWEV